MSHIYMEVIHVIDIEQKQILNRSELGDAIKVDRGFNIGEFQLNGGSKLHIPRFTRKKEGDEGKIVNQSEIIKRLNIFTKYTRKTCHRKN